jgi:CheY-like chemotaxis protein
MIRIDFNRLSFLVIDDNIHMRRILRTLLHGFGTREVHEAEDGAAGLEAFIKRTPDILITDWVMPIVGGLELTQTIRQPGANFNPYVPIIMLTGHSEKQRVILAMSASPNSSPNRSRPKGSMTASSTWWSIRAPSSKPTPISVLIAAVTSIRIMSAPSVARAAGSTSSSRFPC